MIHPLSLALGTLALACVLAPDAAAQCSTVRGSGCPSATTSPTCVTPPVIGTTFSVQGPGCHRHQMQFLIGGIPLDTPIVLGAPLTCGDERCNLNCRPLVVVHGDGLRIQIPNARDLVGLSLCIQGMCVDRMAPCLTLTQATNAKIMGHGR
jgi:hypothetical protein